jgi:hypothetical protein
MAHLKRRWGPYWRVEMTMIGRRTALQALGLGVVAGALSVSTNQASAKEVDGSMLVPSDGHHLKELSEHLAKLPRRRDFKTVPMILTETDQWDAEALKSVIAYKSPADSDEAAPLIRFDRAPGFRDDLAPGPRLCWRIFVIPSRVVSSFPGFAFVADCLRQGRRDARYARGGRGSRRRKLDCQ